MKKIIITFFASIITLLSFGQANTYFHDRIDTTVFAVTDTVGHGANNYYATNLSPDFNVKQYVNGLSVILFIKKGNTGSSTLTLITKTGTLSTKTIRKGSGLVLTSGDLKDSTTALFTYYNGSWRLGDLLSASTTSWMLTGNAGTVAGTNFIGTTDAVDFVMKTNNTEKARISSAGVFSLGLASTNNGSILFRNSTNANTLTIASGVTSASHSWTLPLAQGAANSFLLNNGAGTLSWNTGTGIFWALNGNTVGSEKWIGTADNFDLPFRTNNTEKMRLTATGLLGIGVSTPTATIDGKGLGSDSSTSTFYLRAADGRNILGVQNGGSVGINCLAGQPGVFNGAISDCALEVCSRTNEANNSFIFAAKSYSATQTYFRIRSNSQPGYIGEFYQGWRHFGNIGFNINPDSTRQVQIKGWNTTAGWYPFIVTDGSGGNLLNTEADGHLNTFGYLTTNRLATNASIATVYGGMAINTVKTTIAASGDGSAALRVCGTDAIAIDNGGIISCEAVYDASNKYAMATFGGLKENGTSGNSAGYFFVATHTSGIGSMTERMRITSDGRWYGSALHNNTGSVTGTTNQYVASGTYTATLTAVTNVQASTPYQMQWMRVGNVVTVSGQIDIDPTASAATQLGVSLPIASDFTLATNCAGAAAGDGTANTTGMVSSDFTNNRAQIDVNPPGTGNVPYYVHFTYLIL